MWTKNAVRVLLTVDGFFAVAKPNDQPCDVRIGGSMIGRVAGEKLLYALAPDGPMSWRIPAEALDADGCVRVGFFRADGEPMWLSPPVLVRSFDTVGLHDGTVSVWSDWSGRD